MYVCMYVCVCECANNRYKESFLYIDGVLEYVYTLFMLILSYTIYYTVYTPIR